MSKLRLSTVLIVIGLSVLAVGIDEFFSDDSDNQRQSVQKSEHLRDKGKYRSARAQRTLSRSVTGRAARVPAQPPATGSEPVIIPELMDESTLPDGTRIPAEVLYWDTQPIEAEPDTVGDSPREDEAETWPVEETDLMIPDADTIPVELQALDNEPATSE